MSVFNRPVRRRVPITQPAAGAEFSVAPTGVGGWLIESIRFRLVTDANAATRTVALVQSDTTLTYAEYVAGSTQIASLTRDYTGYKGSVGASNAGPHIGLDLPHDGIWLPSGHTLTTSTDNRQATDQFSNIVLAVIEYPTGPEWTLSPLPGMYGGGPLTGPTE